LWKGKRRDTLCPSRGRCTSSVKYCLKPIHGIHRSKSCSTHLGEIVHNREVTGRIAKWSVELMGETLTYAPHKAVKFQILADFIAEWTDTQLLPPQI